MVYVLNYMYICFLILLFIFLRFKYKSYNLLIVNCIKVIERVFKKMKRKKEYGSV